MLNLRTLLLLLVLPQLALAFSWSDLWFNHDQQGAKLLEQNKNADAAKVFTNNDWKGVAYYRNKQYPEAYAEFKHDNSAQGLYNQGNALANMQKYKEATEAYSKALQQQKNFPDAEYNRNLVQKMLEQQQSKQNDSQQSDKNNESQQQEQQQNSQQNGSEKNKPNQDKQNQQQNGDQKQQKSDDRQQNNSTQNQQPNNDQQQNNTDNKPSNQPNNSTTNKQSNSDKNSQYNNQNQQNTTNPDKLNTQQQQQAQDSNTANNHYNNSQQSTMQNQQQTYQDQQVKAALSQVPDDPGGLLRNKFLRDYQKQQENNDE